MDTTKQPNIEHDQLPAHQRLFIEIENTCPLCNSKLQVSVQHQASDHRVVEESRCNTCEINTRVSEHNLH